MKRFYAYTRVSTTRQGEYGVSLPQQKEAIANYATKNSLSIKDWFEEQETAARKGRPIFSKMLALLKAGRASGVIIHKIDRSARNLKDWADLGELIDAGVEVHFANESLDLNSRGGRLSADIQAVVAADYIRNLREETKKGFYGRLKQGLYPMPAPLGYLNVGKGQFKAIDPERGPLVKKAFELYATGRFTIETLIVELGKLGLRNKHNRGVSRSELSRILNNPFYMGLIRIKKNGETYAGKHEPLISRLLFLQVKEILEGRFNTRTKHHEFAFRRLVKCQECGYTLIPETKKGHTYYRCHTKSCSTTAIREERIEEKVLETLSKLQFSSEEKEIMSEEIQHLKHGWFEQKQKVQSGFKMRLEANQEHLDRLTDAYLDRAIDKEYFERKKSALLLERRGIEEKLVELDGSGFLSDVQKKLELAEDAYSLFKSADQEKKREMVRILSSNLSLDQKNVVFSLSLPFSEVANRTENIVGSTPARLHRTWRELLLKLVEVCGKSEGPAL